MMGAHLSRCHVCRCIIHHIGKRWLHKGGVAYSDVGGPHYASPHPPDPAGEPPSPADGDAGPPEGTTASPDGPASSPREDTR